MTIGSNPVAAQPGSRIGVNEQEKTRLFCVGNYAKTPNMLHICFSSSASGIIRRILRARARNETVFTFVDDLSAGPITDVCGGERKAWYLKYFAEDMIETEQLWDGQIGFWSKAIFSQDPLMVWLTRRSAAEYCGFLELLSLLPEKSEISLADFTSQEFDVGKTKETCISIGSLNEANMDTGFQIQTSTSPADWNQLLQMWKNLKRESASLRIVEHNKLFSKLQDYFDGFLFQHLSGDWQSLHRVVGEAVVSSWENDHRVSFYWFNQRIRELTKNGFIEIENRDSEQESVIRVGPNGLNKIGGLSPNAMPTP